MTDPSEMVPDWAKPHVDLAVRSIVGYLPDCFGGGWFEGRVRWAVSYCVASALLEQPGESKG